MVLANVCSPALIYLVFSLTQVTIDTMHGNYNKAFIKLWVCMIFTLLLNHLCHRGLGLVSWLIVFIPFLLMSIIVTMLLVMFGLDPETGKLAIYDKTNNRVIKAPESSPWGDPRDKNFDYNKFEEPSISAQQQDVLNNMKARRSDPNDNSNNESAGDMREGDMREGGFIASTGKPIIKESFFN